MRGDVHTPRTAVDDLRPRRAAQGVHTDVRRRMVRQQAWQVGDNGVHHLRTADRGPRARLVGRRLARQGEDGSRRQRQHTPCSPPPRHAAQPSES
ncbi:hypothetical protein WEB32_32380 [Streptomyces netropsis]|uniref:Uncharacterized protein n=1 Tax=Streptomyces netropsis TaxID=55404 RepID=A0A7W7L9A2_STRNE|nr:hypothetical protein [Streptomyces netropsis]MBB4885446.1 hypothetical protein [Streptomyces netropsis]